MDTWEEFAVVTGGASAALTGLLFVAVSIRLDVIAASPDLRSRAAQTLTLFLSITLVAILFAIPEQPEWLLGAELIALAVVGAITLLILDRRAGRHQSQHRVARVLDLLSPNAVTMALIGLGDSSPSSGWSGVSTWRCQQQLPHLSAGSSARGCS